VQRRVLKRKKTVKLLSTKGERMTGLPGSKDKQINMIGIMGKNPLGMPQLVGLDRFIQPYLKGESA
jgi:hypothetical protein